MNGPGSAGRSTIIGGDSPVAVALDLRAGMRIGAYELERVIARGGLGVVYAARHRLLERVDAVKLLPAGDDQFRKRFLREARTTASLRHPGIVSLQDAGEQDDVLYLVMDLIDGIDLARMLREQGLLAPRVALGLVEQVADGLQAAHDAGVVHRDVKPANVLVAGERAYLTDFGLTKSMASSQTVLTARGQFVGTTGYVAPEQIQSQPVDARTDVYSLACLIFEVVTGTLPFTGKRNLDIVFAHLEAERPKASARNPELPVALDDVLVRGMAIEPGERYSSCPELTCAMRQALEA